MMNGIPPNPARHSAHHSGAPQIACPKRPPAPQIHVRSEKKGTSSSSSSIINRYYFTNDRLQWKTKREMEGKSFRRLLPLYFSFLSCVCMWTCHKCQKRYDSTVAWDCFPPDYQKICLKCKWFQHEATPNKLEFALWCPYCSDESTSTLIVVPCELHSETCATMKAVEALKAYRKNKHNKSSSSSLYTDSPVTDEEDLYAERIKQQTLRDYHKLRNDTTSAITTTSNSSIPAKDKNA